MTGGGWSRGLVTLTFDDPEFEGLVVRCRRPSIGMTLTFSKAGGVGVREIDPLLSDLASLLVDWNMVDPVSGDPIPTTVEGVRSCDLALILAIMSTLTSRIAGVPAPLVSASGDGEPSLEESIPMEILSGSPPNSPTPA